MLLSERLAHPIPAMVGFSFNEAVCTAYSDVCSFLAEIVKHLIAAGFGFTHFPGEPLICWKQ